MLSKIIVLLAVALLAGCSVNQSTGGQQLDESGKVILETTARIAFRHYVADHAERSGEIVANVRAIAATLATVTENASVSGLRSVVQTELDKRISNPLDLQDAHDLLDVFEALLREKIGKDEIDSAALVQVNEFADMLVRALPAV